MLKRVVTVLAGALAALVVMVGAEIWLALRREYLPTEPALSIEGTYGEGPDLRFVVLGDSTAAGLGTDEENSYPTVLAQRLAEDGFRVHMTSLGVSGARVNDVLEEQLPKVLELKPDLVFIGIGANDATHLTRLSSIESDMRDVLEALLDADMRVVVAGAPDMRAEAFYEPLRSIAGWRGARVTDTIEDVALSLDVPVVPLAELTGRFFDEDPEAHYASDEFHPNALGYRRWADAIYPYLAEAVR